MHVQLRDDEFVLMLIAQALRHLRHVQRHRHDMARFILQDDDMIAHVLFHDHRKDRDNGLPGRFLRIV